MSGWKKAWIWLGPLVGGLCLVLGLGVFGLGAIQVQKLLADKPSGFWGFVSRNIQDIQIWTLIGSLIALSIIIVSVVVRNYRSEIAKGAAGGGNNPTESSSSFWQAFPFASLVFFLVAVFMVCDLALSVGGENPPEELRSPAGLLLKLGMYLVAALITAIVALYGAHLVGFESKVHDLTNKTKEASGDIAGAAKQIKTATEELTKFQSEAKALTKTAQGTYDLFSDLEATAGLAFLALQTDAEYRNIAPSWPNNVKPDPYIRARSCQAIASDEAVLKSADHTNLPEPQIPVARNMISSFLEEMAWDLSQRVLVTNAHNYTSFLVSAARGFEEQCLRGNTKLRVFYLTHTVAAPAHLLNWPQRQDGGHWLCQPASFMFEYMTYCRYFACKRDHFIHARLISAEPDGAGFNLSDNPFAFTCDAVKRPQVCRLPNRCNAWGIPHWGRIAVGSVTAPQYFHCFHPRTDSFPFSPTFPNDVTPHVFAAFPHETQTGTKTGAVCISNLRDPHSLHWPIFYETIPDQLGVPKTIPASAGDKPDLAGIITGLTGFLEHLLDNLLAQRTDDAVRGLIEKGFENLFLRVIRDNVSRTDDTVDAAHQVLAALESFQSFRWAFQGETAVKAWEDLRAAVFMLVNVLLAQDQNRNADGLTDFSNWFDKTFHSSPELAICCPQNKLQAVQQHNKLRKVEFALIGLVELEQKDSKPTPQMIMNNLQKWLANDGGAIQQLMGLRATVQPPWEHATIEWIGACSRGRPELENMVHFYADAMEAGLKP